MGEEEDGLKWAAREERRLRADDILGGRLDLFLRRASMFAVNKKGNDSNGIRVSATELNKREFLLSMHARIRVKKVRGNEDYCCCSQEGQKVETRVPFHGRRSAIDWGICGENDSRGRAASSSSYIEKSNRGRDQLIARTERWIDG